MGLFNLFGKKEKESPSIGYDEDGDELVTVTIKKSQLEFINDLAAFSDKLHTTPEGERIRREIAEAQAQQEADHKEQQDRRLDALRERGVAVDSITVTKCRNDLFDIARTLCDVDLAELGPCEREVVTWQQLTKTGNVPKCVATYSSTWTIELSEFHRDFVTGEVGYLADGTPYTAWVSDLRGSGTYYKVKTVDGELALIAANPM